MSPGEAGIVQRIRTASGVAGPQGPDDAHILAALSGFVRAFDYWYIRVVRSAVPKYRSLLIARINPFIRRMELSGLNAEQAARRLVIDWNSRNFVTAGGWALEEMAATIGHTSQKAMGEGIDIQRVDAQGNHHLYVLKSGLVTRNSDIVKALKRNARQAEKLLKQGRATASVNAYWAIYAGKTSNTFEDGIHRPSSAEFWSHMTELEADDAVRLVFAIAEQAGGMVTTDSRTHIAALELVTRIYIQVPGQPDTIDWPFIIRRVMKEKTTWKQEDKERHKRAMDALTATGYTVTREEDQGLTPPAPNAPARRKRKKKK